MRIDSIELNGAIQLKNLDELPAEGNPGELYYFTEDNSMYIWRAGFDEWQKTITSADDVILADGTIPLTANWDAGDFDIRAKSFTSDVATGTPPFVVTSTTLVSNLNSQYLNGKVSSKYLQNDSNSANTITGFAGTKLTLKQNTGESSSTKQFVIKSLTDLELFSIDANGVVRFENGITGGLISSQSGVALVIEGSPSIQFQPRTNGYFSFISTEGDEFFRVDATNIRFGMTEYGFPLAYPMDVHMSSEGVGAFARYSARIRAPENDDGGLLIEVGDTNGDQYALNVKNIADSLPLFAVTSLGQVQVSESSSITNGINSITFDGADSIILDNADGGRILVERTGIFFEDENDVTFFNANISTGQVTLSQTGGLKVDLNAYSNKYIELSSPSLTHGMTALTDAHTFAVFNANSTGGLHISSYTAGDTATTIRSYMSVADNTHATTSVAPCMVVGGVYGAATHSARALSGSSNLFVIRNYTATRVIVSGDGNLYLDSSVNANAFDEYDDVALVRALEVNRVPSLQEVYAKWLKYNKEDLQKADIATFNEDGSIFVNYTKLGQLHSGAIWQLGEKLKSIENVVQRLQETVTLLTSNNLPLLKGI